MTRRAPFPATTLLLLVLAGSTATLWGAAAPDVRTPSSAASSVEVMAVPATSAVATSTAASAPSLIPATHR